MAYNLDKTLVRQLHKRVKQLEEVLLDKDKHITKIDADRKDLLQRVEDFKSGEEYTALRTTIVQLRQVNKTLKETNSKLNKL